MLIPLVSSITEELPVHSTYLQLLPERFILSAFIVIEPTVTLAPFDSTTFSLPSLSTTELSPPENVMLSA